MNHQLSKFDLSICRACTRLISIRSEGLAEFEAADRHWDGGEWSGPAWGDIWQEIEEGAHRLVANRYDVYPDYVMQCMMVYENEEQHYFWKAVTPINERPLEPIPYGDTPATLSGHKAICHEFWERGLKCRCIPEDVKTAIRSGARPEEVM